MSKRKLRSQDTYGKLDKDGFIHRSWMKNQGLPDDVFDGRPIIGICNTWSELTPCNTHLRELAEYVKRGVWEAGGVPLEFPAMSLGETQMRPTAMLFRNLLAMEVEESIRGNPIDGVVLLGGCDKTTPGQVMGACSVNLPTIVVSSGPMLNGKYRGKDIGSGTDVWKFSEAVRAGTMSSNEFMAAEGCMSRSRGTCMTMGTASTMSCLVETLGLSLRDNATLPAVDARRQRLAHLTGRRIVHMVHEDLKPSDILTRDAFINAIKVLATIGGSSNAVVHLLAIAKRLNVDLHLDDFDRHGAQMSCLLNLMPAGRYLMEDFHYAGGLSALLSIIKSHLQLTAKTVNGCLGDHLIGAENFNVDVIRASDNPVRENAGIAVLRGNLCPDGALIKPAAASPHLLQHRGRALVFSSIEDFKARIDDPELDVDENSILVLQGCGPRGYPGMPEVGNMPLPKKLLQRGINDMLRISDARMSGTAFGTVVLHVSPESDIGGPLALVKTGDEIEMDVAARRLHLCVSDDELAARRAQWQAPVSSYQRGWTWLYQRHVNQAHLGADLDFLSGGSGADVARESH